MRHDPDQKYFKKLEEDREITPFSTAPEAPFLCVRLDGRAFRTFTRTFYRKPFDENFVTDMNDTAFDVMELFPRSFGFVASDEISLIVPPEHIPFGGRQNKIVSTSAAVASVSLSLRVPEGRPTFDSRAFVLKNFQEILQYITWRRLSTRRNTISAAAEAVHGRSQVERMNTHDRLVSLEGTRYEHIDDRLFFGRFLEKLEKVLTSDGGSERERYRTEVPATREVTESQIRGFLTRRAENLISAGRNDTSEPIL